MLIGGNRVTELVQETLLGNCPNCGTKDSVQIHVFQRYGHIFWIPCFPMKKTIVSQCTHCKQVLNLKSVPSNIATESDTFKSQIKTPIWTFTGSALFVLLISLLFYTTNEHDKKNATLILSPKSGDIYDVEIKEDQFTLFKVDHIKGDSVYVRINQYETDKSSGLMNIRKKGDDVYSKDLQSISFLELKAMFERHEIIDIER